MIFIVDDDSAIRKSLGFLLNCEGLSSRSFATAEQFLELPAVTGADFLITDLNLPGMSGLELLEAVRRRGLGLPVVLMTAQATPRLRRRALDAGAAAFLEKPLKDAEILSLIHDGRAA
jgi:two-component system response regulator FixJ